MANSLTQVVAAVSTGGRNLRFCGEQHVSRSTSCVIATSCRVEAYPVKAEGLRSVWLGAGISQSAGLTSRQTGSKKVTQVRSQAADTSDVYIIELPQPIGIKFFKGSDGGTYVDDLAPGLSAAQSGAIEIGDKVLEASAVFGDDLWPAAEYGRTMYAIKQRVGIVKLKMQKKFGVKDEGFVGSDKYLQERNAGNVGDAIREKQIENYLKKVELQNQRKEELSAGLQLYRQGSYEEAMIKFETVLGLQPESREEGVASYNVACCYSKLNQIDAALLALEVALDAGFEDYKAIRTDPDLATVRTSEKFKPLLERYDEPFINENAMKAISSVFGFFGKK